MTTEWRDKEYQFNNGPVGPGVVAAVFVGLVPAPLCFSAMNVEGVGARPFRSSAIVVEGDTGERFQLVQWFIGDRALLDDESGIKFAEIVAFGESEAPVAEVGALIAIYVKNVSTEDATFVGKLVGHERIETP